MITALSPRGLDPSCVLHLPLRKLDGDSFPSREGAGLACTNSGSIWTPRGRLFDGTNDYIDCGSNARLDCSAITIIVWLYLHSYADWQRIIAFPEGFTNDWVIGLDHEGDGSFGVRLCADDAANATKSSLPIPLDELCMVAFTGTKDAPRIFVDNAEAELVTVPDNQWWSSNDGPVQVAANGLGTQTLSATIPLVLVHNRIFTPQELSQHYFRGKETLI